MLMSAPSRAKRTATARPIPELEDKWKQLGQSHARFEIPHIDSYTILLTLRL